MKKLIFICLAQMLVILFISTQVVKAQEQNAQNFSFDKLEKRILIAEVNIYNAKLISQQNNKFKLQFEISNGKMVQPGVKYGVQLVKQYDNGQVAIIDEYVYKEILNLNENQLLKKQIEYDAPNYLNGNYELWVVSNNQNGLTLGMATLGTISLKGNEQYVEIMQEDCHLEVKDDPSSYTLNKGVDVKQTEELKIVCLFKNHFNSELKLSPHFKTFYRSSFGKEEKVIELEPQVITMAGNEVGKFTFTVPKANYPQAYDVRLSLRNNQNKEISNKISFRYVLKGISATIQNLRLDKKFYKKGEEAQLFFTWSGSADGFMDSRHGATEPGDLYAIMTIKDANGNTCAEQREEQLNINNVSPTFKFLILEDCSNPIVTASIQDATKNVLDKSNFEIKNIENNEDLPQTKTGSGIKKELILPYIVIFIFLSLFILSIIMFIRQRKKISTIIFVLVFGLGLFSFCNTVKADTFISAYMVGSNLYGGWSLNQAVFTYNLNKQSFAPNEAITGTAVVSSYNCDNALYDYSLIIEINGVISEVQRSNNVIPHSLTTPAPSTPGSYSSKFSLRSNICFPEIDSCTFNEAVYVENKLYHLRFISYLGRTNWNDLSTKQLLIDEYGSVMNHYNQKGKADCTSPPCENISPCKEDCQDVEQPYHTGPLISMQIPYEVQASTEPIIGDCGSRATAYASTVSNWPASSYYCDQGTNDASPSFPASGATVNWNCVGLNDGATVPCSASRAEAISVDGDCGSREVEYAYTVEEWPALSTYCEVGTNDASPAFPAAGTVVNWNCSGINGGDLVPCQASRANAGSLVNGACGSRYTTYPYTTYQWPSSSTFCSAGTINSSPIFPIPGSSVSWTCEGSNGGTNATCTASRDASSALIHGACGNRSTSYPVSATGYLPNSEPCSAGVGASPPFPTTPGTTVNWICRGLNGGDDANCSAYHSDLTCGL